MRVAPRLIAAFAIAVLAAALAACGGDDSGSDLGTLEVSAGGSAQFIEPGGDNSVQNFGREAGKAELTAAATVLHEYAVARAEKDYELACSHLSKKMLKEEEQLATHSPKVEGEGCPATFAARAVGIQQSAFDELTEIDAASLRIGGNLNFLIYRGAKDIYFTLMAKEGGVWKVDALSPTAF